MCWQLRQGGRPRDPPQSEDCLNLNVFTRGAGGSAPVIVWLFGGNLVDGSASSYGALQVRLALSKMKQFRQLVACLTPLFVC